MHEFEECIDAFLVELIHGFDVSDGGHDVSHDVNEKVHVVCAHCGFAEELVQFKESGEVRCWLAEEMHEFLEPAEVLIIPLVCFFHAW